MPMKKSTLFSVFVLAAMLIACNNEEPCEECALENEQTPQDQPVDVDTQLVNVKEIDTAIQNAGVDENFKENKKKIVEKFGEQWDFCTCVIKNDSVNKAIQNGSDLTDKFLARMDTVEFRCKAFLTQSKTSTPEDRAKHEEKIANCLKAAKK